MLTELCQELKNWFVRDIRQGTFTIESGNLTADFLSDNQYFRIVGSIFNDGVHKFSTSSSENLTDETFTGEVWALAIPAPVIALASEIDAWRTKYEGADSAAMSPFQSESFGGYSYSKGSSSSNSGSSVDWRSAFASRLNMWRKI